LIEIRQAPPPLFDWFDPTKDWPPFLDHVAQLLREKKPVVFAWGDAIYNPEGGLISVPLMAHETVHCERQLATEGGVREWWLRYIHDPAFRLAEEVPAHRKEYEVFCTVAQDRNARAMELHRIALRLSGPFYGHLIDHRTAKHAILGKEELVDPSWRDTAAKAREGQRQRFRARAEDAHQ